MSALAQQLRNASIYVLTTQAPNGDIIDLELFSERPAVVLAAGQTLRVGHVDGGDSIPTYPRARSSFA